MLIIVTGGAGFIGSAFIRHVIKNTEHSVVNIDKLTYAGNLDSLSTIHDTSRYSFKKLDICSREIKKIFKKYQPDAVINFAAESHVDRSIDNPDDFINTNIFGVYNLLSFAHEYWLELSDVKKEKFRFLQVSTDEVFGSLDDNHSLFDEDYPYAPRSPYSASKASADHLVRAWHHTYSLPTIITNCSNNYGPYHHPEKFIPHVILNALSGNKIPIYGDGLQIRDWLYVDDHARALLKVLSGACPGSSYNIGGFNEKTNLDVANTICSIIDSKIISTKNCSSKTSDLIYFVDDRPGHDRRYAIDSSKISKELGWMPQENFETGILKTVDWYIQNDSWWKSLISAGYDFERIGVFK